MLPSSSPETGRDPWSDDDPPPRTGPAVETDERRRSGGPRRLRRGGSPRRSEDAADAVEDEEEEPPVEVRRQLSLAIGGFAVLLGVGLIVGAQSSGPGHRMPFTVVVFTVQLLFLLAWTMVTRPPALAVVLGVNAVVAVAADVVAVRSAEPRLGPLGYVAIGGVLAAVLGQLIRRVDRARVTDSLRTTTTITLGVVGLATLIVLSRMPAGTQTITVCLTAAAVALLVARAADAAKAWPRLAPQVPRGAAGVVGGAMVGTLVSALLGSYLVLPFTPTKAALIGLVAAVVAVLADLAVGYADASRRMAGELLAGWGVRHVQGPLGAVTMLAPAAYLMCRLLL
ncbi:hypothetical protein [Micromonospora endophytica]|uniref:CDP-diglyceride synthetase n=1 Tax=Micromonospora endophytica TaxID=515350 RepID=A0A2W2C4Y9_9ACTN|nr:hypothetical protein [Micromonospora endophytica]PZF92860.1 hypothetical protein C1I93_18840 [Micromonospora endophytica]RIW48838.1 hypothetical protein D3H59_06285 [Micromonospora endophytica]